jgi:hypothetical protein
MADIMVLRAEVRTKARIARPATAAAAVGTPLVGGTLAAEAGIPVAAVAITKNDCDPR